MVITLNPLLKFSAGQWNTLVNIELALCGLAGQDCIGTKGVRIKTWTGFMQQVQGSPGIRW
eukprot:gene248-359_t